MANVFLCQANFSGKEKGRQLDGSGLKARSIASGFLNVRRPKEWGY
jgi:hypothetical protein